MSKNEAKVSAQVTTNSNCQSTSNSNLASNQSNNTITTDSGVESSSVTINTCSNTTTTLNNEAPGFITNTDSGRDRSKSQTSGSIRRPAFAAPLSVLERDNRVKHASADPNPGAFSFAHSLTEMKESAQVKMRKVQTIRSSASSLNEAQGQAMTTQLQYTSLLPLKLNGNLNNSMPSIIQCDGAVLMPNIIPEDVPSLNEESSSRSYNSRNLSIEEEPIKIMNNINYQNINLQYRSLSVIEASPISPNGEAVKSDQQMPGGNTIQSIDKPGCLAPNFEGKFLIGKTPAKRYGRVRSWNSESTSANTRSTKSAATYDDNTFKPEFDKSPTAKPSYKSKSGRRYKKTLDDKAKTDAELPVMTISNSRTIYTHGRPPWYSADGEFKDAFLIGICGGSASGKTTVAKKIIEKLNMKWVVLLSMDCFYKDLNEKELDLAAQNEWNFDAPHSFDLDMCVQMLQKLKKGKAIDCPQYDFTTHQRDPVSKPIYGANVIIFEGILAMCDERLRDLMDLKIFVDTDSDVRLARRLKRDMSSRARDLRSVIAQYEKFVKPAYDTYIHPLIKFADIVIPRGGENAVAINLITQQIQKELKKRFKNIRQTLVNAHIGEALPDTLSVLPISNQVKGIHTILRNRESSRDDFIFYSNRLMRLLFEYAFAQLPHETIMIETPQKKIYKGSRFAGKGLCGVSILRAGETMENALLQVTRDIRLGKILIQTNHDNSEPELHFLRLPQNIEKEHVILMDATVATGAAAMMAIRILLDHGVLQKNIILTSLLMAETGIHTVAYAYPKVKLVTTAVDKTLDQNFHIVPGMGNFGDRYFGTDKDQISDRDD